MEVDQYNWLLLWEFDTYIDLHTIYSLQIVFIVDIWYNYSVDELFLRSLRQLLLAHNFSSNGESHMALLWQLIYFI